MNCHSYIRVLGTIFLCLLLHFPSQTEAKDKNPVELIMEVCKQTIISNKKTLCVETLKANPETAAANDHKTLATIALGMTKKLSTKTSELFNNLAVQSSSPESKKSIKECEKYFDETVGMLNLGGLEDGTATLDVHYAYDNAHYCETALANANVNIGSIPPAIQNWKNSFEVAYAAAYAAENDN